MGQLMFTAVESVSGRDAKTLEIKLTRPYGLLIDSIAKISSNVPFMMPKAIAETDPFKQIENAIGSGPFIFRKEQWVPGSKVVYDKNPNYVPRKEPASGAAGAKIAKVDRVEWLYIPDPTTCMNALISGEVDYYEQVPADLAPILAKAPGVKIETLDPIGSQGMMRFNHLVAPTNNPLVRRAIMRAVNQKDVLAAAIGNPEYYQRMQLDLSVRLAVRDQRRRRPRDAAEHRGRQEAARGGRLQGREDRHPAALRHSELERLRARCRQGLPRHRHECRPAGARLVVGHLAPRQEGSGRSRRLEHVPDLVDRRRPAQSAEQRFAGRRPEQGVAGMAE